jgi:hypothetical protein
MPPIIPQGPLGDEVDNTWECEMVKRRAGALALGTAAGQAAKSSIAELGSSHPFMGSGGGVIWRVFTASISEDEQHRQLEHPVLTHPAIGVSL